MKTSLTVLLALAATASALSCGQDAAPTQPGPSQQARDVIVSLVTPNADDGALILTITGPDVASVASTRYMAYARSATNGGGSAQTRITIVGDLAAGPLVTLHLSAPHDVDAYSGTIEQVARRTDALRDTIAGYRVTVAPAIP